MKIHLIFVGKTREKFLSEGIDYYLKKINHYVKTEVSLAKPVPVRASDNSRRIVETESKRIINSFKGKGPLILLDREGARLDSVGFSNFLKELLEEGHANIFFAIGGPLGVSRELKQKADYTLSLSDMTFTHEMSRLILTEQIYRALTILRGEKYHK